MYMLIKHAVQEKPYEEEGNSLTVKEKLVVLSALALGSPTVRKTN